MRSIVLLGLAALVCGVCCRDLRIENLPRQLRLQLKDKRGLNDHPVVFPSHGSSYSAPIHPSLGASYNLGGSSGGFSLGHAGLHGLSGPVGHGIGYPIAPSNSLGLGSGYLSSGLGHGPLNLQGVSLGGHSAQSTQFAPSIANIGGGSNGLFTPSKNGPVTFGLHGGSGSTGTSAANAYSMPVYASGNHGLSAYSNGNLPIMLAPSHGTSYNLPLSSSGSSAGYSLPTQPVSSSSSHSVTGGLIIATGPHSVSSSYNLPTSGSSHGAAALSSSQSVHGAPPSYTFPITSGSHGVSALAPGSTSSGYSTSGSPGSYSSGSSHIGLSSGSSVNSNYELPVSSGSYSSSGSGSSPYTSYLPATHGDSSVSYSSSSGSSYSSPSVTYASPNSNYASSSPDYSSAGSSYSALSSSYASPTSSYSSPAVTYAGTSNYTPAYGSSSGSYGSAAESQGAYSSVNPRYLGYTAAKAYESLDSGNTKYDTISYSSPNGKY
ncbi:cell wall protein AWA1-like [Odontomachus brunneus]|uniref:cell wall protein AWA1-like n=1 Tax=Odontomachus brunneus TaxID=486640 RepID=UPI0013F2204F|nr:cell wall protein AWA1-like [Odontomachus brunneus]